jgi:threonine/homoserine/homoserine lactone efflux protein
MLSCSDRKDRTMEGVLAFVLAGLALAGSPGPNTLSLAAAGAAFGTRRSAGYMIGLVIGMAGVMAITASGLTGLVQALPGATPVVVAAATLYFVYLAVRIATAPPLTENMPQHREPKFFGGVFQSLINPKGYAAMAALFSGFVLLPARHDLDVAVKIAVLTAIIIVVNVAWLFGGAALTRFFREPRTNRIINVTFAVLLIASVAAAMLF